MRLRRLVSLAVALCLAACAAADFNLPGASGDGPSYAEAHPYFFEYCALSQILKKPGFGADIRGQIGGHAVFYLNGACRVAGVAYPVLALCRPDERDGVGITMNEHFRNAKWVAVPGHDFFFDGGTLAPQGVTRADYARIQAEAKRLGIYDGVTFHDDVFDDMPPGWMREDWKYEVSIGTDYATSVARGRYCALLPVSRAQMARIIADLNAQNAPYRGGAVFNWDLFRDNCIHLAHNALAAIGLWAPWPVHHFLPFAMLDFPVPRNEFVNIMLRTNDALPPDPAAAFRDAADRRSLHDWGMLPTRAGALALARPVQTPNEVYDTDVGLAFYDDPMFGAYQPDFDRIFARPRYIDARSNAAYFARRYREILAARRPLAAWRAAGMTDPAFAATYDAYYAAIGRALAALDGGPE